jgi:hypothetical protein
VAGSAGVFRSLDAGRSWSSLNESLPNLPAARIRSLPEGSQGARIELPAQWWWNGSPVNVRPGVQPIATKPPVS